MSKDYNPDEFKAGEMDTSVQENTFDGFMKVCIITTVATIAVLIFLLIVGV
jgi:hypothetical protein